jgi:hypothetical protein
MFAEVLESSSLRWTRVEVGDSAAATLDLEPATP